MEDELIRQDILTVLRLLVEQNYDVVAAMTKNTRLTEAEIQSAIEEYGRTLVMPPGDELPPDTELHEVSAAPRTVFAAMSLWTLEEGRSDLGLELLLTEVAPGLWTTQIDNVRVM